MLIEIQFDSETPIYMQIRNEIVKAIATGKLKDGDGLPSVRQMSSMIEVNLHTINKAYNILKSEGYVQIDRRKGVIVKVDKKESYKTEFEEKMELILSESFLMGISEEEVLKRVKENFKKFSKED
ncbi:hypothetical protein HMPREF1092_02986 [Clostridium thermobutyricum]|uniref:HTH gntR-type domain-containing protein n=1 Tax=Clostridium thermobutyricum TaxID=29372 RepID=N9W9Z2_9CLOT|nr:GntR family transcriptional regulator [Clostridium thermobutyricum]ENY99850.1 hypothetical protein HMPREF1092_02986 [Clostridium thermobutyricum]